MGMAILMFFNGNPPDNWIVFIVSKFTGAMLWQDFRIKGYLYTGFKIHLSFRII